MKYIYEMVDVSDDGMYYAIGLYETIEEAVNDATKGDEPLGESEEYMLIEIRRRAIGVPNWSGIGKVVATIKWEEGVNEKSDEWAWLKPEVKYIEESEEV